MSTFMAKKETLERKWYVIDAANRPLGRTLLLPLRSSEVSIVLNSPPTLTAVNS